MELPSADDLEEHLPRDFGKYRLTRRIATGGMAEIFLAHRHDAPLEPLVIKRILPHLVESEGFVSMFLDEARIAASLDHPSIVRIDDIGQIEGQYFLAMEYIHGEDVRCIYNQAYKLQRSLPLSHSIRVIADAARALAHAHRATDLAGRPMGLVHRDVSPQNILVTYAGHTKVVDFGIAKAANKVAQTRAGVLKGKYSYMSPEQALGEGVDHRTDLFALGIILYETTTGTRLFKRSNELATLQAIIKCQFAAPSEALSGYPRELERIVLDALEKDPARRYQDGDRLADDLERFLLSSGLMPTRAAIAGFMADLFHDKLEEEEGSGEPALPDPEMVREEMVQKAHDRPVPEPPGATSIDSGTTSPDDPRPLQARLETELATRKRRVAPEALPGFGGTYAGDDLEVTRAEESEVLSAAALRPTRDRENERLEDRDEVADEGYAPDQAVTVAAARAHGARASKGRASQREPPDLARGQAAPDASDEKLALAKVALAKVALDEVAPDEAALAEVALAKVALDEVAPDEAALAEVALDEAAPASRSSSAENKAEPARALAFSDEPPGGGLALSPHAVGGTSRAPAEAPDRAVRAFRGYAEPTERIRRRERPAAWSESPKSGPRPSSGPSFLLAAAVVVVLGVALGLGVVLLRRPRVVLPAGPAMAEVTILTEPGAEVFVDGDLLGLAGPEGRAGPFDLEPGPRLVRVVQDALRFERQRSVKTETGRTYEVEIRARKGFLKLRVAPWAQVTIDDKPMGLTPLPLVPLFEGLHEVVLENPELGVKRRMPVRILAGEEHPLEVLLEGNAP